MAVPELRIRLNKSPNLRTAVPTWTWPNWDRLSTRERTVRLSIGMKGVVNGIPTFIPARERGLGLLLPGISIAKGWRVGYYPGYGYGVLVNFTFAWYRAIRSDYRDPLLDLTLWDG